MTQSLRMKDMPDTERPRERLAAKGPDALSHAELIAILLRTGLKGMNAVDVGSFLIKAYGNSLHALAMATVDDLRKIKGIGRDKAVTLIAAFELAQRMAKELPEESPVLDTPEAVVALLRAKNRLRGEETLQVLLLNVRRRLIRIDDLAQGTVDTILFDPRQVLKPAIAANAAAIIIVHNHPSGDPSPSEADIKVTRDLIRAAKLLKIEVLDHVILGRKTKEREKDWASLRELGHFYS